jgi:glycosyltransferase involved in cell wall biosynthesis
VANKPPYILWLPSWYPNKIKPFDGDFIQRHSRAAALYDNIHVIHLVKDDTGLENVHEEIIKRPQLTEQIIYYKPDSKVAAKIVNVYNWLQLYKKAIRKHIEKHGLPALVHVHVPWKAGILALWIKRKYKIPFLVTEHWGIYNDLINDNYRTKTYLFKLLTSQIIKSSALLLCVSNYSGLGINQLVVKKKFEIIVNTVDTDLFFLKEISQNVFRFIHISNAVPLKNLPGIISAATELYKKGYQFELVIAGSSEADFRKQFGEIFLSNQYISFRGEVTYERVALEMQQSNCLILFSEIENSPCVIGEALCCGLPVISSSVGGIPELVTTENSLLIPSGDKAALISAMEKMMQTYPGYNRKKIAEAAAKKFSYNIIGKQINQAYSKVN